MRFAAFLTAIINQKEKDMKKVLKKNIVNTELYNYCSMSVLFNFAKGMLRYKFNGEKASGWVPACRDNDGRVYFVHEGKGCIPMSLCLAISRRRGVPLAIINPLKLLDYEN